MKTFAAVFPGILVLLSIVPVLWIRAGLSLSLTYWLTPDRRCCVEYGELYLLNQEILNRADRTVRVYCRGH